MAETTETNQRRCPACAGAGAFGRGDKNGVGLVECRACATLYATREPARVFDYDAYYDGPQLAVPDFIGARLDEIFASLARYRRGAARLLDIGCGAGTLLEAARRAGWAAAGTEVSPRAAEGVRGAGFEVFCGDLAEARYPEGHFDVVTASELLEHLPDPRAMVREVARVLRPGGLFWATTPHWRGLSGRLLGTRWSAVSPTEHLQLFSLGGVRALLSEAGFRRPRVTSRGCDPFEVWRAVRGGRRPERTGGDANNAEGCARVAHAYSLNAALVPHRSTRAAKAALNAALRASRLGDSIRIWAER